MKKTSTGKKPSTGKTITTDVRKGGKPIGQTTGSRDHGKGKC